MQAFLWITVGLCLATRWHSGKESPCQCRRCNRCRFDPWVGKIPWSRRRQPTPVFMPVKFHGQRSLAGYSLLGCRVRHDWACMRACTHVRTHTHTHTHTLNLRNADISGPNPDYCMCACMFSCFIRVWLFPTLWTEAHQAPLSMGFSRQAYWSGLPSLLQGIFPTQGSNPHLLDFRTYCIKICILSRSQVIYRLEHTLQSWVNIFFLVNEDLNEDQMVTLRQLFSFSFFLSF